MKQMSERVWLCPYDESHTLADNGVEYIRADLVASEMERLNKALDQAIAVTALRYLPPKEVEGSDGRVTALPAGLACSHRHDREGWTDYTQLIISENQELVDELLKRGVDNE